MSSETVHLDYIITLEKIEIWPPNVDMKKYDSQSLHMHWIHDDKMSEEIEGEVKYKGIDKGVGDAIIEFHGKRFFELHVTLSRKMSVNSGESETFEKNCIEFKLCRNGKKLASADIDFAEHNVQDSEEIKVLMKLDFKTIRPPKLCVKIERKYFHMYKKSIENPPKFWSEIASKFYWKEKSKQVNSENLDVNKREIYIKWFEGGVTNICYNCLDVHIKDGKGDKPALLWEGKMPGVDSSLTYTQLRERVCQLANFLIDKGVKKGDNVIIYLPMIMELPITMLACARIGAVHSVVVAGYSTELLSKIIKNCEPKIVVTCNAVIRGEEFIDLKKTVDDALSKSGISVDSCLVFKNESAMKKKAPKWQENRDIWWQDKVPTYPNTCDVVEWVDAEHPLFILYTSGSTPKGLVHTTGGYMIYTATTFKYAFDYKESDVYWCTADCGWITGHSYVVYGPLLNGAKIILYEEIHYPNAESFWKIVKNHEVTLLYTSPKLLQSVKRAEDEFVTRSCKTLRVLGSVGEPLNESAWSWFCRVVGNSRCSISYIWWQTETGGFMITQKPAVFPRKPGSNTTTYPFFGIKPVIVDEKGVEIDDERSGYLCIKGSWPGAFRELKRYPEGYQTYFKPFPGYNFSRGSRYGRLPRRVDDVSIRGNDGNRRPLGSVDDVIDRLEKLQLGNSEEIASRHPDEVYEKNSEEFASQLGETSTSADPSVGN